MPTRESCTVSNSLSRSYLFSQWLRQFLQYFCLPAVFLVLLGALISGCSEVAGESGIIHYPNRERPWDTIPTVTISAGADDPRVQTVLEAVEYWNSTLGALGTPFRIGPINYTDQIVPAQYLEKLSAALLSGRALPEPPEVLKEIDADLIVALSDGDFVSFSTAYRPGSKVLVGIRSDKHYPLNLPNVTRNVIAHELGHAIGLGHNNDHAKLMCGRPAPCRPEEFHSSVEGFFPLSEEEKAFLLKLYPASWRASR
jgi:hypothetical protein